MTPLACERCKWHGDESEAKLPDVRPDEAEANNQICPKCEGELFEVLVEGVNYKVDADGIIRDRVLHETDCGSFCCSECFAVSTDDYRGFAVPSGCSDEECECHTVGAQVESALVKAAGLALLAASGGAFVAAMVWG